MCKIFRINGYKKMLILKGLTITYTIINFLIDFVFYVGFIRDFLGLVLYNEKMGVGWVICAGVGWKMGDWLDELEGVRE